MPPTVDRHISVRLNRGCLASVTVPFVFSSALVNLYTHDIEAGLHFYRDLLGFVETFRTPTEGVPEHVELRLNEFTIGLGTVEAAMRVHGVDAAPGSPATSHTTTHTPNTALNSASMTVSRSDSVGET
jgi:uncharacterized glyoxalase superfamily protein PhnB